MTFPVLQLFWVNNTLHTSRLLATLLRLTLAASAWLVPANGAPLGHQSKSNDILFFAFKSVSRVNEANTFNMNAPSRRLIGS
jgi:hypothetical protein